MVQDFCSRPVHPSAKSVRSHPSHKMDKLTERISSLTLPRDRESDYVPEGLVDSLPPEGMLGAIYSGCCREWVLNHRIIYTYMYICIYLHENVV